jgi:hypothetical protein
MERVVPWLAFYRLIEPFYPKPGSDEIRDIVNLKTRNDKGQMVPIGSVAQFRDITGPYRVPRYNLYPAAEVQGSVLPGYSTGYALAAMEKLAADRLPDGFGFDWTDLAYQQKLAGNTGLLVFGASIVFVFLVLAAQWPGHRERHPGGIQPACVRPGDLGDWRLRILPEPSFRRANSPRVGAERDRPGPCRFGKDRREARTLHRGAMVLDGATRSQAADGRPIIGV